MADSIKKLSPDRDLQCYFYHPSAIAALSQSTANGFVLSGTWRQQFDWAVIEWSRDNVFEHPSFRYLPDGDLSGLTLTYEESRSNCIALDSDVYPTVDWPTLRIWADPQDGLGERIYFVPLINYAQPASGVFSPASAVVELQGSVTPGDYVGVACQGEHYSYQMTSNPLEFAVSNIVDGVNAFSPSLIATQDGTKLRLTYLGTDQLTGLRKTNSASVSGARGNSLGLYTYVSGASTESWDAPWKNFEGGLSPTAWRVTLPFGGLVDRDGKAVPIEAVRNVRKMRWTYAADLQSGSFVRSDFQVRVTDWRVVGAGGSYVVAGPGSRRIEDDDAASVYSGMWNDSLGYGNNFSGGKIHCSSSPGSTYTCSYTSAQSHRLYLGTRMVSSGGKIEVSVDGVVAGVYNLGVADEDVLIRVPLGEYMIGHHVVHVLHVGSPGSNIYIDFLDIVIPSSTFPTIPAERSLALATDWDTDHSISLPAERTAGMIQALGFNGRVNHYAGALWFYQLLRAGHSYASATVMFSGTVTPNAITQISVGRTDQPVARNVAIVHLNLIGDTPSTVAKAFELVINSGYTAIWAKANGNELVISSRSMGVDGNSITLGIDVSGSSLTAVLSHPTLTGGIDGIWTTDLAATPRINRAALDWTRAFCAALKAFGRDAVTIAFSTELQHGDPSVAAGIAQRYPSGSAVMVNTPALQTNFSPQSTQFWRDVYLEMAQIQSEVGLRPYLQFGEVQWWYFVDGDKSGMPFYDAYTTGAFRDRYGRDMTVFRTNSVDPATAPDECAFLAALIGAHTNAIMAYVRQHVPDCRFEVLYPNDVNSPRLNRAVNFPSADWTPDTLDCLKTESFTYTYSRNLDLCLDTIDFAVDLGFPKLKRSHLVGAGDASSPWVKEARLAESEALDSVVIFALDQLCLIGYELPLSDGARRSVQMG